MTKMKVPFSYRCPIPLDKDSPINIPIGYLPKGDFTYPIVSINPCFESAELVFCVYSNKTLLFKKEYLFTADKLKESINFSIKENDNGRDIELVLSSNKGSQVWLYLPISPRILQKIETVPIPIRETVEKIVTELEDKNSEVLPEKKQVDNHDNHIEIEDTPEKNKNIVLHVTSHLKGVISLEQAQRQLEYVIYNKWFLQENSKGLKKWKLGLYRKVIIYLYRRLTKNSTRKAYFTKLYRNYINNNIIADNLQAS